MRAFVYREPSDFTNGIYHLVLLIFILVVAACLCVSNFVETFSLDDDKLFYGITAFAALNPVAVSDIYEIIDSCAVISNEDLFADRSDLRRDYIWNYAGLSALWGIFLSGLGITTDAADRLDGAAFMRSFLFTQLLMLFATALIVWWKRDLRGQRVFGWTVSVLIVALLAEFLKSDEMWLTRSNVLPTLRFVLSSPDHFNIFNFAPRGISALLLLGLVTLRWTKQTRSFYLGMLLMCTVHQSNATMAFLIFFSIDILLHRSIFRDPFIAALSITIGIMIALREEMFAMAGWPAVAATGLALIIFALVSPVVQKLIPAGGRPLSGNAGIEVLLIAGAWLASLPVVGVLIGVGEIGEASGRYLFWQLHSRLGTLLLASIVCGAAMVAYPLLRCWSVTLGRYALICTAMAMPFIATPPVLSLPASLRGLEGRSISQAADAHAAAVELWNRPEVVLYYDTERAHYYSIIAAAAGFAWPAVPDQRCAT